MTEAVDRWRKDLEVGTLDLRDANPGGRERLLGGRQVPMSKLYPYEAEQVDVGKRLRTIHRKIRELQEERGIHTGLPHHGHGDMDRA